MAAFIWSLFALCVSLTKVPVRGTDFEFQALFTRIPQTYINAFPLRIVENATVEDCARQCVREVDFECKSFDIDNRLRECHLHNHSHTEPLIGLQESLSMDHYRTGYEKLFNRIPNHIITLKHRRNIRGLTVEECARRCLQEMTFNCRGFDYETRQRNCWLTDKVVQDSEGLKKRPHTDFYERRSNGHLSRFINYGYGSLQTVEGIQIHKKLVLGVNLEACAQLCLAETAFKCSSFDYVFTEQSCQMSHLIAANVHGMRTQFDKPHQVMHFELIEENLAYFYPTPFASVLGNNDKTYKKVTPDTCARKCLEERDFICRSFDYQVTEGTCLLSHVTGSDAGGLYTPGGVHVHHFELKPSLDCGDKLTTERGSLASPNWPRHYSHHLNCTWSVTVPQFKIIRFEIYHLDLGSQSEDPCSRDNDVLGFSEVTDRGQSKHCARNYLTEFVSQTNKVNVTFTTNAENDAQGFRIFYNADWPCTANLTKDNGEFASPRWPHRYPAMTSCYYLIKGPVMSQIYLRFNSINLEDHFGSRCKTAYDKIYIYDGNSSDSSLLETLCGNKPSTSFKSMSNSLYVEFTSDSRVQSEGFHASYQFIHHTPTTTSSTTTTSTTTSVTTGATLSESALTNQTNELANEMIIYMSGENESVSVNLALRDSGQHYKQLDATFVEPTELDKTDSVNSGEDNVASDPGITGDDIGRGLPSDKSSEFEQHEKTIRAIIWGTATSFLLIFIIILTTVFMTCRYHKKRQSIHREGTNMRYPEENMSLFGKTGSVCAQDLEDDVDDDARLPLPDSPDPPADVEFFNPLYVQRNKELVIETTDLTKSNDEDTVSTSNTATRIDIYTDNVLQDSLCQVEELDLQAVTC